MEARIPRYIDDPPQFLFWELDELILVVGLFGLGIFINYPTLCGLIGIILARLAGMQKSGKADGYLWHFLYWFGLVEGRPNGSIREMHE
ncbi:MAG: type IV conjugative transfer system protein TraL [Nitrospiria bacterium]